MKFIHRRLLSWLLPDDVNNTREEVWNFFFVQGNFGNKAALSSSLNDLIKKNLLVEEDGRIKKTPEGVKKAGEIRLKNNC